MYCLAPMRPTNEAILLTQETRVRPLEEEFEACILPCAETGQFLCLFEKSVGEAWSINRIISPCTWEPE